MQYRDRVQFFVVYIREAHAIDGAMPLAKGPLVEEHVSLEERSGVAQQCMTALALEPIPALVDGMDDAASQAYDAWPDRMYLIARDGTVAFQGEPGPWGFDPEALAAALAREVRTDHTERDGDN